MQIQKQFLFKKKSEQTEFWSLLVWNISESDICAHSTQVNAQVQNNM